MQTITLRFGRTRALIAPEAGGRIVQIEIEDGDRWLPLLVAPDDLATLLKEPLLWGCYPMTPWPGRIDGARFAWQGASYGVPVSDGVHSIHGRGVYLPWAVVAADEESCELALDLGPDRGWPFACRLLHTIRVEDDGLRLALSVEGRGSLAFPAGVGWHPWFRRDVRSAVMPRVRVAAARHHDARTDLIPTGGVRAPAGGADLSGGPEIGGRQLDDFYGGVEQPMEMCWGELRLAMTSSANCEYAVVYTRSDRGFCVEPQTCVPDAFNLAARGVADTGVSVVKPGETMVASTEWQWTLDSEP